MQTEKRLPGFVAPMLAGASEAFDSDAHLFEVKWDGIRALAFVEGDGCRLVTRHRRDVTDAFPELEALARLRPGAVLDGELVVLRDGVPHLGGVQSRQHTGDPLKTRNLARTRPTTYVVFDLLYVELRSVMAEPLVERRRRLREIVEGLADPRIVMSEGTVGAGTALFAEVCRLGLEGVMAKRLTSRYRPGRRSRAWLKIKPHGIDWSSAPSATAADGIQPCSQ
jgi:ATP-dependent DNA ligase